MNYRLGTDAAIKKMRGEREAEAGRERRVNYRGARTVLGPLPEKGREREQMM